MSRGMVLVMMAGKKTSRHFTDWIKVLNFGLSQKKGQGVNHHKTMHNKSKSTTKRLIVALTLLFAIADACMATARYHTRLGGFGSLSMSHRCPATETDGCLVVDNQSDSAVLVLDTVPVRSADYRCQVRLANEHNRQGKTYKTVSGRVVSSTVCGLVLNASADGSRYVAVELSCHNTALHDDLHDARLLDVAVIAHDGDSVCTLASGVDLHDGFNCVEAVVRGNSLSVSIGSKRMEKVMECALPESTGPVRAGCLAGPACQARIERVVVAERAGRLRPVSSGHTIESLNALFAASRDPFEGYWQYLDRETDDAHVRLGGRYKVALVADGNGGYTIIYIDGAQVRRAEWHTGMVKGTMAKTVFTDNYRAVWTDASFGQEADDVFAVFESGSILSVKFPVLKSQLRFSKMPVKSL